MALLTASTVDPDVAERRPVDRGTGSGTAAADDIDTALAAIARDLGARWASALERGDSGDVTRLVEASHAVQRARLALMADSVVGAGSSPWT